MILNKSRSPKNRYYLVRALGLGLECSGELDDSPMLCYNVAWGSGRRTGFEGYMSLRKALRRGRMPPEARRALIQELRRTGHGMWLDRECIIDACTGRVKR